MTLTDPLPYMLGGARRARLGEGTPLAEAVRWFERCRMLRDFENQHLLAESAPDDLRAHRVIITDIIADGEILAWQAANAGTDFSPVGFTIADIEAEVRLLRDSFRMFHDPMPSAEADPILEAAFGQS